MTTLDHRLYAWLVEPDEPKFQRAFHAYYSLAFPALVRHLARLSRWDAAELEELAQDALLRFFDRVGRRRREASDALRDALVRIRPLDFGPFHVKQVNGWSTEVSSFRDAAMGFCPGPADAANDAEWKAAIRILTDRIPPLQRQGYHLLHALQLELRWSFEGEPQLQAVSPGEGEDLSLAGEADCLAREVVAKTARALAAEARHGGFLLFVDATHCVIRALPLLRVPTNGYLFEIAMTIYLDECKRRGRKKRMASPSAPDGAGTPEDAASAIAHPLERMAESAAEFDHETLATMPAFDRSAGAIAVVEEDPTRRYEAQEFLEKFYAYLRAPVDAAQEAFETAQANGRGAAERRRLESLAGKFERTIAVLSMMGEGYTQEQTAERLELSRNQVKYVIELVQEAYTSFRGHSHGQ